MVSRLVDGTDGEAALNGELTVKKLRVTGQNGSRRVWLVMVKPPAQLLEWSHRVLGAPVGGPSGGDQDADPEGKVGE